MAAVITSNITSQGLPLDRAFTDGFWLCAGVAAIAVVASLVLPGRRRNQPVDEAAVTD